MRKYIEYLVEYPVEYTAEYLVEYAVFYTQTHTDIKRSFHRVKENEIKIYRYIKFSSSCSC
jgi:hypothetical protein